MIENMLQAWMKFWKNKLHFRNQNQANQRSPFWAEAHSNRLAEESLSFGSWCLNTFEPGKQLKTGWVGQPLLCWCLSFLSTISLVSSLAFKTFSMRFISQTPRSSIPSPPSKWLHLCHWENQLQLLSAQFLQKACCSLLHITLGANEALLTDDVTIQVSFLHGRFLVSKVGCFYFVLFCDWGVHIRTLLEIKVSISCQLVCKSSSSKAGDERDPDLSLQQADKQVKNPSPYKTLFQCWSGHSVKSCPVISHVFRNYSVYWCMLRVRSGGLQNDIFVQYMMYFGYTHSSSPSLVLLAYCF